MTTAGSEVTSAGDAVGDHLAEVQHRDAMGQRGDHADVVLDEEDGRAGRVQLADEVGELRALCRPQAGGRLVEKQQPGPAGQRPRHLEAALLAQRQALGRPVRQLEQSDAVQALLGLGADLPLLPALGRRAERGGHQARPRTSVGTHHHVLQQRHACEQPGSLEHDRHTAARPDVGWQPVDVRPGQADRAGVRTQVAGDQVEQRRLAGAVGTDHPAQLALGDLEADVPVGVDTAEVFGHPFDLEHAGLR